MTGICVCCISIKQQHNMKTYHKKQTFLLICTRSNTDKIIVDKMGSFWFIYVFSENMICIRKIMAEMFNMLEKRGYLEEKHYFLHDNLI